MLQVSYINYHYGVTRKNKNQSGQHGTFDDLPDFVRGKKWLLFYHDCLQEVGDTALHDGAFAELPKEVFMTGSSSPVPPRKSLSPLSSVGKEVETAIATKNADYSLFLKHKVMETKHNQIVTVGVTMMTMIKMG